MDKRAFIFPILANRSTFWFELNIHEQQKLIRLHHANISSILYIFSYFIVVYAFENSIDGNKNDIEYFVRQFMKMCH